MGTGDRVVEVGAGLGSLTVALADAGADVLAIELDRALLPALEETVGARTHVLRADATTLDWHATLGEESWILCANLPYNVATPIVLDVLAQAPMVRRLVVMVQREVAERLAAGPGDVGYGIPSVRVAYRATARLIRRVPREVFWPRPAVGSAIVRLDRLAEPAVSVDEERLRRIVDAGFAQRRKTMRNALRSLGLAAGEADDVLRACGVDPGARAEELGLRQFGAIAGAMP